MKLATHDPYVVFTLSQLLIIPVEIEVGVLCLATMG